jgi:AbrB family looped-hinge helix DNA binding protein
MAVVEYIAGLTTKGRVTIPKAMRDGLGWHPSDKNHFILEDDVVRLVKVSPTLGDAMSDVKDAEAADPDIRRLEP